MDIKKLILDNLLWIFIYYMITNIIAFIIFGIDKNRAIKKQRRISEKSLFFISFISGSFGTLIAMEFFRHKYNKIKFRILIPIFFFLHFFVWGTALIYF